MNKKMLAVLYLTTTAFTLVASTEDVVLGWATSPFEPFGSSDGDIASAIAINTDKTIILAGSHVPVAGFIRFAALQLIPNMSGSVDLGWTIDLLEPFGPSDGDRANGVAIDADGNFILAGFHRPAGGDPARFAALQLIPNISGGIDLGWATALLEPFGPSDGDRANGVAIDASGNVILAGIHNPDGINPPKFAALQLIPNMSGGVDLGWATALVEPFGPSDIDQANGIAIDADGNIILAGFHNPTGNGFQPFAALQLIPNISGGVDLGWATAPLFPFGPGPGDQANGIAIGADGTIILAGTHNQDGIPFPRFAALQLIPNISGGVGLGWTTSPIDPFGPGLGDRSNGIAVDANGNVILAGSHNSTTPDRLRFAALQLVPNAIGGVNLGWVAAPFEPFGPSNDNVANGVAIDLDGNIILAGANGVLPLDFDDNARFAALQLIKTVFPLPGLLDLPFISLAAA